MIIDGDPIAPSDEAVHVGVVRSTNGNTSHLSTRIAAHRRAIFGLSHTGLGMSHGSNPLVSIKIEQIYGTSVLLSGLSSVVLSASEERLLDQYY